MRNMTVFLCLIVCPYAVATLFTTSDSLRRTVECVPELSKGEVVRLTPSHYVSDEDDHHDLFRSILLVNFAEEVAQRTYYSVAIAPIKSDSGPGYSAGIKVAVPRDWHENKDADPAERVFMPRELSREGSFGVQLSINFSAKTKQQLDWAAGSKRPPNNSAHDSGFPTAQDQLKWQKKAQQDGGGVWLSEEWVHLGRRSSLNRDALSDECGAWKIEYTDESDYNLELVYLDDAPSGTTQKEFSEVNVVCSAPKDNLKKVRPICSDLLDRVLIISPNSFTPHPLS